MTKRNQPSGIRASLLTLPGRVSSTVLMFTAMLLMVTALGGAVAPAEDCGPLPKAPRRSATAEITVVKSYPAPVLAIRSPEAKNVSDGFEGGTVVRAGGQYHLFTTEPIYPFGISAPWAKTRLADWVSPDGFHWRRVRTIFTATGDFTGKDRRAALWAPMPVYDSSDSRWNLFYVAYRAKPNTPDAWYLNFDGELVQAVSLVKGPSGIDGPYRDAGVILRPGPNSDKWEGLQGDDSVYPYRAGGRWFAFYGTAHTEKMPCSSWEVGLASSAKLSGPWKRCTSLNPVPIEPEFIENPVVTKIGGVYIAIYDVDVEQRESIGYVASSDGIHWGAGKKLRLFPEKGANARTPLALIPNADGTYDLFVTARSKLPTRDGKKITEESIYLFKVHVSIS